ncbi:Translation initiation factor IF-1 [Candidatus Hepatincola sp. Pdp]
MEKKTILLDGLEVTQDEKGITLTGEVIEILPNTKFKVKLQNGVVVLAHTAGKMRKNRIRIILFDKVTVRISNSDIENLKKKDTLINARLEYRFKA